MAARFVDALKGYEFFVKQRGKASLEEVNEYLAQRGYRPISLRTYTHYHKLQLHGFRYYIPINKFDVFQALGRLQTIADRRRYFREKTEIPVQISRDGQRWVHAFVIDKSVVGFGIFVPEKFPVGVGKRIFVRMAGYRDIPVIVVWRKHLEEGTRLGARGFSFVAQYQLTPKEIDRERLRGDLVLRREEEGALQWRHLLQVLERTDELLHATEDLLYSVSELVDKEVQLAPPLLIVIKYGSPGLTQIKIDLGIAEILKALFDNVLFYKQKKAKMLAEIEHQKLQNEEKELENTARRIEVARRAIELGHEMKEAGVGKKVVKAIMKPVQDALGIDELPADLFKEGTLERSIVEERLLPAAIDIVAGDDLGYDVSVGMEQTD